MEYSSKQDSSIDEKKSDSGYDEHTNKRPMKIWHSQQEKILKKWGDACTSYRWLHYKSYRKYKRYTVYFTLPVIIISTITGVGNFAQQSFSDNYKNYMPLIIGFFNILAGIITTVSTFLRVSEQSENHRVTSLSFGKLARNINLQLSLPLTARSYSGQDFVKSCKSEIDRLLEQAAIIPKEIIKHYEKQFENLDINRPEIIDIKPIEIFTNKDRILDKDGYYSQNFLDPSEISLEKLKHYNKIELSDSTTKQVSLPIPETRLEIIPETRLEIIPETRLEIIPETNVEITPEIRVEIIPETNVEIIPETNVEIEPEIKIE